MGKVKVVLFPFMARGHIVPFLALARRIYHQTGYHLTLVTTPLNIKKLRETFQPPISAVELVEIPFNSADHDLPPDSEDSDSLPYNLALRLLQASAALKSPFRDLLSALVEQHSGERPVAVISDLFFGWAADVAHQLGIFHAVFSITGGFGMACYCSVWLNSPHHDAEGAEFHLPDFPEAGSFHVTQLTPAALRARDGDPFTDFQRRNLRQWSNADAILFNTVENMDEIGLNYFRRKLGVPVWGIGPLLFPEQSREATISAEQCIEWLNKKDANSVIYVSFGSRNTISASQMMNLAKALDASGRCFVWVVRPPLGCDINAEFVAEQWLPEDFLRRIRNEDRGLIVSKWAPQVEILAHKSVSVFISHCGWSSVLESLSHGVPLIGWPLAAEQFYNAKFLVEKIGVCVEVARGTNFDVRHEDIKEKLELVMGENAKGRKFRGRCLESMQNLGDAIRNDENYKGCSVKAMQDFLDAAFLMKDEQTRGH